MLGRIQFFTKQSFDAIIYEFLIGSLLAVKVLVYYFFWSKQFRTIGVLNLRTTVYIGPKFQDFVSNLSITTSLKSVLTGKLQGFTCPGESKYQKKRLRYHNSSAAIWQSGRPLFHEIKFYQSLRKHTQTNATCFSIYFYLSQYERLMHIIQHTYFIHFYSAKYENNLEITFNLEMM